MSVVCTIESCGRPVVAKGFCNAHYHRFKYGKSNDATPIKVVEKRTHCVVDGCMGKHIGHGFCYGHYERFKKHGDPLVDIPLKKRSLVPTVCKVDG